MTVLRRRVLAVGLPVLLVAVWWLASAGSTDFYRPPLSTILAAFADTWTPDRLAADVVPSVLRLAAGYAAALCTTSAYVPQVIRVWRTRSTFRRGRGCPPPAGGRRR